MKRPLSRSPMKQTTLAHWWKRALQELRLSMFLILSNFWPWDRVVQSPSFFLSSLVASRVFVSS
jgi:hypothetical protein